MKVITVGRSAENNVVINDPKVSRVHLQIVVKEPGVYSVVDLGSANGTYVNGQKITGEMPLNPDDSVRIGDTTIRPYITTVYYYDRPGASVVLRIGDTIIPLQEDIEQTQEPSATKKNNRLVLYICISLLALLLIGGGALMVYRHIEKQKIETEQQIQNASREREKLRQQKMQQEAKEREDMKKAEDDFQKALIDQSNKNKKLAEKSQEEAENAKKQAVQKEDAMKKAQIEEKKAREEKEAALKKKQEAEDKSKEAIKLAEKTRNEADKKVELTDLFYSEKYVNLTPETAQQVCECLKVKKTGTDAKTLLRNLFAKGDNAEKQRIIDAIDKVFAQIEQERQKNNKPGQKTKTTVPADSTDIPANVAE